MYVGQGTVCFLNMGKRDMTVFTLKNKYKRWKIELAEYRVFFTCFPGDSKIYVSFSLFFLFLLHSGKFKISLACLSSYNQCYWGGALGKQKSQRSSTSISVLTPSNGAEHCAESCPDSEEGSCDCVSWCPAQTPAGQCSHTHTECSVRQFMMHLAHNKFSKSLSVAKTESEQSCGLSPIGDQSKYLWHPFWTLCLWTPDICLIKAKTAPAVESRWYKGKSKVLRIQDVKDVWARHETLVLQHCQPNLQANVIPSPQAVRAGEQVLQWHRSLSWPI